DDLPQPGVALVFDGRVRPQPVPARGDRIDDEAGLGIRAGDAPGVEEKQLLTGIPGGGHACAVRTYAEFPVRTASQQCRVELEAVRDHVYLDRAETQLASHVLDDVDITDDDGRSGLAGGKQQAE